MKLKFEVLHKTSIPIIFSLLKELLNPPLICNRSLCTQSTNTCNYTVKQSEYNSNYTQSTYISWVLLWKESQGNT